MEAINRSIDDAMTKQQRVNNTLHIKLILNDANSTKNRGENFAAPEEHAVSVPPMTPIGEQFVNFFPLKKPDEKY